MRAWLAYSRLMTDAPDIEQLARRYLDLWQDQTAALINDPALAEAMGRTYALMSKAAAAVLTAARSGGEPEEKGKPDSTDVRAAKCRTPATAPAGAAPIAPSPGDSGVDAAEFAGRLAALEERVVRLEAALAASRRGPQAPSR
jgi:hypothetical protein